MDAEQNRQNTVNHLIKAASLLPTENYHQKLLKSFYLTKCKKLAQSDQRTLFSDEEMCRKCSTPWIDLNYSVSIAPIKTTKRKAQKIQKQIDNKSNRKSHLAKKLSKKINNTVTIKCKLCDSKNRVLLWKKTADAKKHKPQEFNTNLFQNKAKETIVEPSLKKKRKKDKNAGLLYSMQKDNNDSSKKIAKLLPKPSMVETYIPNLFDRKPKVNKNKGKTANGPKTKQKNTPKTAPKRHSLLHLANALKSQSNQPKLNSQEDKLKKLLR